MNVIIIVSVLTVFLSMLLLLATKIIGQQKDSIWSLQKEMKELVKARGELEKEADKLNVLNESQHQTLLNYLSAEKESKSRMQELISETERMVEEQGRVVKKRVQEEVNLFRVLSLASVKEEVKEFESVVNEKYEESLRRINKAESDVRDLEAKHNALLELWKREDMEQQERDYYRIMLSQDILDDIQYIRSVLSKLTNQKVVSEVIFKAFIQPAAKEMINRVVGNGKVTGVYRISHLESRRSYIGQGVDVGTRLMQHIKGSFGVQSIADQPVHKAMADEGLDKWMFELVEECDREDLNEREKYYILQYESNVYGYNKRVG